MKSSIELKVFIRRYVEGKLPGYLSLLNNVSLQKYGRPFLDLFLESPSRAYRVLIEYHRDPSVADFALVNFFIRPLVMKIDKIGYEYKLLRLMKERRDKEFFGILGIQTVYDQ